MSDKTPPADLGPKGVTRRKDQFTKRFTTKIWDESPSEENPYIADSARCHGYDLLELMSKRSYVDVLFLLFRGELPNVEEAQLLESLMIALINPGPRHPATRAAMNAGVGKTDPAHILPIGLSILGGEHLGAGEIEPAMRWMRKHSKQEPEILANELLHGVPQDREEDVQVGPGFGSRFGSADLLTQRTADKLASLSGAGELLLWGQRLSRSLSGKNMGWLSTGLAAAVFGDLGFQPRAGAGLFQILSAPGLFAHGIEMANKPLTAMPFPDDADYFIERPEDSR